MKRKRFLAIFVLCSVLAMLLGAATTYAQTSLAVISSYQIKNDAGSDMTDGPLMAGATYTVLFEINVGVVPPDTRLSLATPMEKAKGQDVYWNLKNDYPGIDTELWQPGLALIEFDAVEGIAKLTVEGCVPSDYTTERLSNDEYEEYLHFPKEISLVELSLGPDGNLLDERSVEVIDQKIDEYQQTLTEKKDLLQTATIDPTYAKLATKLIALAEDLSDKGYVENAKDLLDTLPSSVAGFPIPVSQKSSLPYVIGIVVLAVILTLFVGLFLRARSNSSFIRQQVDEEAGRLDVLSVRISKIDKQLGGDIDQVKEQLERIIGR